MLNARNRGTLARNAGSESTDIRVWGAMGRASLEQPLASAMPRMPAVSLLLVQSRLWTRYTPSGNRTSGGEPNHAGHGAGPIDGDVVVVTGEAVLRSLLDEKILGQRLSTAALWRSHAMLPGRRSWRHYCRLALRNRAREL